MMLYAVYVRIYSASVCWLHLEWAWSSAGRFCLYFHFAALFIGGGDGSDGGGEYMRPLNPIVYDYGRSGRFHHQHENRGIYIEPSW